MFHIQMKRAKSYLFQLYFILQNSLLSLVIHFEDELNTNTETKLYIFVAITMFCFANCFLTYHKLTDHWHLMLLRFEGSKMNVTCNTYVILCVRTHAMQEVFWTRFFIYFEILEKSRVMKISYDNEITLFMALKRCHFHHICFWANEWF